jgi:hypothetical protein
MSEKTSNSSSEKSITIGTEHIDPSVTHGMTKIICEGNIDITEEGPLKLEELHAKTY